MKYINHQFITPKQEYWKEVKETAIAIILLVAGSYGIIFLMQFI